MMTGREYELELHKHRSLSDFLIKIRRRFIRPLWWYIFPDASRVKLNMNTSSQERFLQWKKKMALETWNIQNVDVINMNYESSFQAERWGIKWWHKATQKSEWWWPCPAITTHVHLLLCMWLQPQWGCIDHSEMSSRQHFAFFPLVLETCLSF